MMRKDTRTTKEADEGRSMHNRKPYRPKALKAKAREVAFKGDDGAWHPETPTCSHPAPAKGGF